MIVTELGDSKVGYKGSVPTFVRRGVIVGDSNNSSGPIRGGASGTEGGRI